MALQTPAVLAQCKGIIVMSCLLQALLGADWPESPEVWETLPGGEIQAAAKKLLEAHNAALNAQGPEMATGVITP